MSRIINDATYLKGVLTDVRSVRRIEEADVIFGSPRCPDVAHTKVTTSFASKPNNNPSLHTIAEFTGDSNTREGMVALGWQRTLLEGVVEEILPCESCGLARAGTCGTKLMQVRSHGTDIDRDRACQQIIGLNYAIRLPEGTSASDVKCIQP